MNDFTTWLGYIIAAFAALAFLRLWWSTRNVERMRLQKACDRADALVKQMTNELEAMRDNKRILETAVLTHKATLREKQGIIDGLSSEKKALQGALKAARKANEALNEILGKQEVEMERMRRDVSMLTDQVTELRAKLGLELSPEKPPDRS